MEDFKSACVPIGRSYCLVDFRTPRRHFKRSYLHSRICHFKKESQRYLLLSISSEWNRSLPVSVYFSEALAASNVKIAGRDVLATWKVLISLGVVPVLYVTYAILATIIAIKADAPLTWRLWTPFVTIFLLPCMSYAALKFGEAGMDILK